jgi:hypothetical protein
MSPEEETAELKMDPTQLYREEVITDQRVGTIRRLTPVLVDGDVDAGRPTQYIGSAQIMTPAGALPLSFAIEAQTLEQAIDGFASAAKIALEQTVDELKELQRQASSSIVLPGMDPRAGGGAPGGLPGGGKFQL